MTILRRVIRRSVNATLEDWFLLRHSPIRKQLFRNCTQNVSGLNLLDLVLNCFSTFFAKPWHIITLTLL